MADVWFARGAEASSAATARGMDLEELLAHAPGEIPDGGTEPTPTPAPDAPASPTAAPAPQEVAAVTVTVPPRDDDLEVVPPLV
jgi:hypothetical protein